MCLSTLARVPQEHVLEPTTERGLTASANGFASNCLFDDGRDKIVVIRSCRLEMCEILSNVELEVGHDDALDASRLQNSANFLEEALDRAPVHVLQHVRVIDRVHARSSRWNAFAQVIHHDRVR